MIPAASEASPKAVPTAGSDSSVRAHSTIATPAARVRTSAAVAAAS
jgi:hypothetical protein